MLAVLFDYIQVILFRTLFHLIYIHFKVLFHRESFSVQSHTQSELSLPYCLP